MQYKVRYITHLTLQKVLDVEAESAEEAELLVSDMREDDIGFFPLTPMMPEGWDVEYSDWPEDEWYAEEGW